MPIRSLVENKNKLDYHALTSAIVSEFGISEPINWDAVIPANVQQNLFGGETLRLFSDHPNFATQKDIRTIVLKKGQTSQLLFLFAQLKDEKLSKSNIEKITKKFIGGSAAERYVVWFVGNPSNTEFKVVLSGKEGKKVVLKTLPFGVNQPYYKTYDFILEEVHKKVSQFFVEPNELWQALWKSFDISVVNKKFYLDIKSAFNSLINNEVFKGSIRIEEARKQFAVRLIGRIIFSWFLKKKNIIAETVLSSNAISKYDNYYLEFLEKLFFEVFNTPQKERRKLPDDIKDYPFLNGGLFEAQGGDYGDYQGIVIIHNEWFTNLFKNTLEKYNFTIDENTSSSSEIAIDPEMLGRIFENLLAEQNPETQESARKSTGSYYTPREIVDYMVEQSISEYLKTNVTLSLSKGDDSSLNSKSLSQAIEDYVHTDEIPEALKPYSTQILEKLNSVKVFDPACGSGAFPIGMLQKLIALKTPLLRGVSEGRGVSSYNIKLQTILNSIYGCDIQPMAVELSRLRCWLSLIIDEDVDKKKTNWNIESLPNLDFKFVCVNTLINLPEFSASFGISEEEFNKLKNLREEYFTASAKRKEEIEEEFKKEQKSIAKKHNEWARKDSQAVQMLVNWNPFYISETPWFDPFWMFGISDGFDVVIGNPPYGLLNKKQNKTEGIRVTIEVLSYYKNTPSYSPALGGMVNIYRIFILKSIYLLKNSGILTEIFPLAFMGDTSIKGLRQFLLNKCEILSIDAFPERDDLHKRIFFAAKMSVCILILKNNPSKNDFYVRIYKEGFLPEAANINKLNKDIIQVLDSKNFSFPLTTFDETELLSKIFKKSTPFSSIGKCNTGEIDMTFCKKSFSNNKLDAVLLKGAIIDRYLLRDKMSQGEIVFIDEKILFKIKNNIDPSFKSKERIVLQGITGVNEKIRLKMMLIKNAYCANSLNYLSIEININKNYVLGLFNSKLLNFIFSKFSTNSNVNGYEIDSLPIIIPQDYVQKIISEIVSTIIIKKKNNPQANTKQLEDQIDIMVYKLYSLTYEEVKIIDPEIENIISKEEYEKPEIQ